MDDRFFDLPLNIISEFDEKIAKAFRIFDHQKNNMIISRDLGAVLRIVGCVPTEKEIQEIIKETEFEQRKGVIHLSRLIVHLRKIIEKNLMKPYSPDDLLNAFKILDPKNRGYIPKAEFIKLIREVGEPISEHDFDEMLKVCCDPITLRINYEEYIKKISFEPDDEDSIFKLAESSAKKYQVQLEREMEEYFDIPVNINDDLDRKIADAFSIFDHHGQKTVDVREIGSILRYLGLVPTEQEVSETIAETEFAGDSSGTVHLSKFLPYVKNLLLERRMEPAPIEKLLEAFQVLDYEGKGFVTKDFMAKIMMEECEPFSLEELEEMFGCAVDSSTNRISYEYYLNQLIIDI